MHKINKKRNLNIFEGIDFAIEMEKLDIYEKSFLAGMVKAFILKKKFVSENN